MSTPTSPSTGGSPQTPGKPGDGKPLGLADEVDLALAEADPEGSSIGVLLEKDAAKPAPKPQPSLPADAIATLSLMFSDGGTLVSKLFQIHQAAKDEKVEPAEAARRIGLAIEEYANGDAAKVAFALKCYELAIAVRVTLTSVPGAVKKAMQGANGAAKPPPSPKPAAAAAKPATPAGAPGRPAAPAKK